MLVYKKIRYNIETFLKNISLRSIEHFRNACSVKVALIHRIPKYKVEWWQQTLTEKLFPSAIPCYCSTNINLDHNRCVMFSYTTQKWSSWRSSWSNRVLFCELVLLRYALINVRVPTRTESPWKGSSECIILTKLLLPWEINAKFKGQLPI